MITLGEIVVAGKRRVAVLFGGQSSEHEVSRTSAESVIKNIDKEKNEIVMIGITKDGRWLNYDGPVDKLSSGEWQALAEASYISKKSDKLVDGDSSPKGIINAAASVGKGGIDVVFPVLHGANGEDGTIQGLFELAGIPYVGCGVLSSAVGMDKAYTKIVFEKEGIPQGDYLAFLRSRINQSIDSVVEEVETRLKYPCFVKPSNAGSSVGVSKASNRDELIEALKFACRYDRRILVEEFIDGREVECAVLGNEEPIASTVGEVVPCNEFYDYKAKYIDNASKVIIPADLPNEAIEDIRKFSVRAFKALDCSGFSRVDFFVHKKTGKIYINEINTIPGFTSISMYPKLWEASGIPYSELIDKLLDLAIQRFNDNNREI